NVPSALTLADRTMSPDGSCNTISTVVNPLGSRTPFGMSSTRETPPTTGGACFPPQAPIRTTTASHLIGSRRYQTRITSHNLPIRKRMSNAEEITTGTDRDACTGRGRVSSGDVAADPG